MNTGVVIAGVAVTLWAAGSLPAQPLEPKTGDRWTDVKKWTEFRGGGTTYSGVVDKVGKERATVSCEFGRGRGIARQVYPINLLADGTIVKGVSGSYAYRWSDLKVGDSVDLKVVHDHGEDRDYCVAVRITRRPGAKLPEGQDPKGDGRYLRDRVLNDIENGEDVAEEDAGKAFPPKLDPRDGSLVDPGGLPPEYRTKLNANRDKLAEKAKKEQDSKAVPPGKE